MKNLFFKSRLARELKQLARENKGKALSILDDVVFKAMLTENNEDSREALRSLISACTHREVSTLQVINNELPPAYYGSKRARVDVLVTFNDGEVANLEMQAEKTDDDIKKRAEYYKSTLVAGQLTRGKPYSSVKRVYQVFFLNCVLFPDSAKLPRRYFYQEETEHDRLSDLSEIILYELPKLKQRLKDLHSVKIENLTDEEKWCIFMKYRHEEHAKELIKRLCREEEGIMHAEKAVTKVSRDYIKFAKKFLKMKAEMEDEAYMNMLKKDAREEGLAEGRTVGLAEGHAEGFIEGRVEGLIEGRAEGRIEGHAEGRIEGHAEGFIKGRTEERQHILELLNQGLPIEKIKQCLEE